MEIIMHFPSNECDKLALSTKIAEIHVDAVCSHIEKLTCPKDQKIELISAIQKDLLVSL